MNLRRQLGEAYQAWLTRSLSAETRDGYFRDLFQCLDFAGVPTDEWEKLSQIRPGMVSAWRNHLLALGLTNTAISRKLSMIRSLFGYLREYGYTGANPAFVAAPPVPRDGKTIAITPEDCRLLDFPTTETPEEVCATGPS